MILCINISERTKGELDRLLELGQYRDYSEAIEVAIANQALLHGNPHLHGDLGHPAQSRSFENRVPNTNAAEVTQPKSGAQPIPAVFTSRGEYMAKVKIAAFPSETVENIREVSVDQWIFGQHNKLLPVKATCRALANLLLRDPTHYEGVPLSKAASEIAGEAVLLGDLLHQSDRELKIYRDDVLAFAFPRSDSANSDKSRLRFASQFVASLTNHGVLTGLPVDLKLVNKDDSRSPKLLLTEAGWKFAQMSNPVLDGKIDRNSKKFSDEEVEFFVDHIKTHVPAESFAIRAVLNAIASGANTPDALDDALQQFLPQRQDKPFTRAFLTTQRAGVISRLSDLGLLRRIRDGIKVVYAVTETGLESFQNS
jgi:hypothetical protein